MTILSSHIPRLYARFDLSNQAAGLSDRTRVRYYGRTIEQFRRYLLDHDCPLDRLAVDAFLASCRDRGLSPFTIRGYYGAIRTFVTWLHTEGLIKADPLAKMKPPRVPKRERVLPQDAAIDRLIAAARTRRDRAIILLTVDANLRSEEVRTLRMDRVYLQSRCIVVLGKGNKERPIVVGAKAFKALLDYIEQDREPGPMPVFLTNKGRPLSVRGLQNIFRRLKDKTKGRFRLHDLRHYGATQDAAQGMDPFQLMQKLGHTSMKQTLEYTHLAGRGNQGGLTADQLFR